MGVLRRHRAFLSIVVLPTLLAALYLTVFASSQYRSQAQFVVRGLKSDSIGVGGMGQLLGLSASLSSGQKEAQSIREYLLSMDAITALKMREIDLVELYRRDGVDILSRLRFADPTAETLLDYYRDHVDVTYDPDDNITRLSVRAFRRDDAQRLAAALLDLGEARVNAFNERLFEASLETATADVAEAEEQLAAVQRRLRDFREINRDIDPQTSGEGGQKVLVEEQAALDRDRAMLADMMGQLRGDSPQVRAMRNRVRAQERALETARSRLTGAPEAVSTRLGNFEELRLRQDFAAKRYEAARGALEEARNRAASDRLFIVPVVRPNLPEKAYAPKPLRTTLLIFIGLSVAYGIGFMLIAGIREHQA